MNAFKSKLVLCLMLASLAVGGSAEQKIYRVLSESKPYVVGFSLWTFNDYRSDYQGTPPSGNREWGIASEDLQPKAAYGQIENYFPPVHSLTVSNGVIQLQPRTPEEVPSFTLRGYKLKWNGGEISLPDLKPGDPPWTSDTKVKPGTIVKLFTPTGYDVADSK
jgi:hypothetical protein